MEEQDKEKDKKIRIIEIWEIEEKVLEAFLEHNKNREE